MTVIPSRPGEYLVKVGKPVLLRQEISTAEAARILGLSQRRVQDLVAEGRLTQVTQPGGPRGKLFLSRSEVESLKNRPL